MSQPKLKLSVITQEKELLSLEVDTVTVPGAQGELTILPNHIPLLTKLQTGELRYTVGTKQEELVVGDGFLDVGPNNTVIALVDSASLARDLSVMQAEEARKRAEEALADKTDKRAFILAEAAMRKAMIELKVARKRSNSTSLS